MSAYLSFVTMILSSCELASLPFETVGTMIEDIPITRTKLNGIEDFRSLPQFSENYVPPEPVAEAKNNSSTEGPDRAETVRWLQVMLPRMARSIGGDGRVTACLIDQKEMKLYLRTRYSSSEAFERVTIPLEGIDPVTISSVTSYNGKWGFGFSANSRGIITNETVSRIEGTGGAFGGHPEIRGSRRNETSYGIWFYGEENATRAHKAFRHLIALTTGI